MRSLAGGRAWLWRVPLVLGGVGLSVVSIPGTAAAKVPPPRGNSKAIAFERAAYRVDNSAPGYVETLVGFVSYFAQRTPASATFELHLDWDTPVIQTGWAPAKAKITWGVQDGTIAWTAATLTAPPGNANKTVRFLIDSSGVRWSVTTPTYSPNGCYTPVTSGFYTPWTGALGQPLFFTSGDFKRPPTTRDVHGRKETFVTYTFPAYSFKQRVTETDGFNTKTKSATSSILKYAAKGKTHPAFTARETWRQVGPVAEPAVEMCSKSGGTPGSTSSGTPG